MLPVPLCTMQGKLAGCRQNADLKGHSAELEGQLQQQRQQLHAMAQAVQQANSQHLEAAEAMTHSQDCLEGFLHR